MPGFPSKRRQLDDFVLVNRFTIGEQVNVTRSILQQHRLALNVPLVDNRYRLALKVPLVDNRCSLAFNVPLVDNRCSPSQRAKGWSEPAVALMVVYLYSYCCVFILFVHEVPDEV